MRTTASSIIFTMACLPVTHLRVLTLLLTCAILPLRGEDPQSISPALVGALRKSGLPAAVESVTIPLQPTIVFGFTRTSTAGIYMDPDAKILRIVPGGPADKAGLRAGDEMLEIEGHSLKTMQSEEFAAFKRLPPGSVVKVRYRRGEASPVEASLVLLNK